MLLELAKPLSFFLSMLSLYPVMLSSFFVPGARWEDRPDMALLRVALSGCVCLASGLLYAWNSPAVHQPPQALFSTLPVCLFVWTLLGMAVLFALSWCLDTYYVPLARRDCCRF